MNNNKANIYQQVSSLNNRLTIMRLTYITTYKYNHPSYKKQMIVFGVKIDCPTNIIYFVL